MNENFGQLVPVKQGTQFCVDARQLHQVLQAQDHFRTWIKRRIEKYDFQEGVDFEKSSIISSRADLRGQKYNPTPAINYMITMQRDEIGNNFGAGPDFYKVSEIPWLYKIFKPHKRLHQLVGRELSKISHEIKLDVKTCHVDKNTNWYRAYQKQAIDVLYERLLENRWLLSRFRISRRKTIPGQCKISQF